MRTREQILANLEAVYRASFERAQAEGQAARMAELDNAYVRDQLMMEVLLDLRELLGRSGPPARR